ncbi:MAG TPA: BrxA/BrxB family bacilliredoxin [Planctomycetota bacterium]|jgi:putative YphP/YqiW family bacilliredoxin
MREELTALGIQPLYTSAEVDDFMAEKSGLSMLVINSVCGCAAGGVRPAIRLALLHSTRPVRVATVFAGQDVEAVATARGYFPEIPPSSPSIAFFKDGQLVHFVPRHMIEGRSAEAIAADLVEAFEREGIPAQRT